MHTYIYTYIQIDSWMCVHALIHAYLHTYIHTYIQVKHFNLETDIFSELGFAQFSVCMFSRVSIYLEIKKFCKYVNYCIPH